MGGKKYTCEEMIEAIRQAGGIVSQAARILGCSRQTVYRYANEHPTVQQARENEEEKVNDLAEQQLIKAIKDGKRWAIKYRLSRKAVDRGYGKETRHEHVGKGGGPIQQEQVGDEAEPDEEALMEGLRILAGEDDASEAEE